MSASRPWVPGSRRWRTWWTCNWWSGTTRASLWPRSAWKSSSGLAICSPTRGIWWSSVNIRGESCRGRCASAASRPLPPSCSASCWRCAARPILISNCCCVKTPPAICSNSSNRVSSICWSWPYPSRSAAFTARPSARIPSTWWCLPAWRPGCTPRSTTRNCPTRASSCWSESTASPSMRSAPVACGTRARSTRSPPPACTPWCRW